MFIKINRIYDDIVRSCTKRLGLYRERNTTVRKVIKSDSAGSDLTKIKAYQIYYDESQKDSLIDGFIPHFNEKATVNLESGVICDLVNRGECSNCDWFGVFSWKIQEKIKGFDFETLKIAVSEYEDCDLLAPNPKHYWWGALRKRRKQKEVHPGAWQLIDLIVKKLGLSDKKVLEERGYGIYCNAFLARTEIYLDFVNNLLKPAIELCNYDKELNQLAFGETDYLTPPNNFIKDTGLDYYPWIPFVLERLIMVYVEVNDIKIKRVL